MADRGERKLTFTPGWLEALKPEARPVEYTDDFQRGLVLRVQPTGRKIWIARYVFEGRERRYTLGTFPELKLKPAREHASRRLREAATGVDPQAERERLRAGKTAAEAVGTWLADL